MSEKHEIPKAEYVEFTTLKDGTEVVVKVRGANHQKAVAIRTFLINAMEVVKLLDKEPDTSK